LPIRSGGRFSLPAKAHISWQRTKSAPWGGSGRIVFVLNNDGYLIERAFEENPNWTYNDLAPWKYAELPKALGCVDWFTARVTTLGELDDAMKAARASKTGAYIEIIGGKLDMPPALAFAHGRLKAMYGDTP
jgi:indolepyruvate decarboxylase